MPFTYLPLRDPRTHPVVAQDLVPLMDFETTVYDEFYAKFMTLVTNRNFDEAVFGKWSVTYSKNFDSYKPALVSSFGENSFYMASTTGYLMAVSEAEVFTTFRSGEMASYIPEAMKLYINQKEGHTNYPSQQLMMTGLFGGYHKAHDMYSL